MGGKLNGNRLEIEVKRLMVWRGGGGGGGQFGMFEPGTDVLEKVLTSAPVSKDRCAYCFTVVRLSVCTNLT